MNDGWNPQGGGHTVNYPQWKWYNFIKKRKFARKMRNIKPGERIKFGKPVAFNEDFTIITKIEVNHKKEQ